MGGLGPGIGGFEYLIIALAALLVVGPERLPLMLRKLGQWASKARRMADEFRSSFDEMARQSELDELRKEVEALRRGQSNMMPLGPEAEATFREIRSDLNRPLEAPAPALSAPGEWPDSAPVMEPLEPTPESAEPNAAAPAKPARARKTASAGGAKAKAAARKPAKARKTAGSAAEPPTAPKPRAPRRKGTPS